MSEEGAEKVSEASPNKKDRARKKGDVPVSQEANTAAALGGFFLAFLSVLPFAGGLALFLKGFFLRPETGGAGVLFGELGGAVLLKPALFLLPLTLLPAALVVAVLAAQQSIVFAPSKIKPDLKKINPVEGAKKKFGGQALVDFLRNSAKVLVLTTALGFVIASETTRLAVAFQSPATALAVLLRRELIILVGTALLVTAAFAAIDLPLVRMRREQRLRMSAQETKDEAKESEGDQNVKSQRRRRGEKIATGQMIRDVKTADVVMTNPTHYAVALKYDRTGVSLPVCVAKGTDEVALRLRQAAREAGVPVREDPPATRALYAAVELGGTIKEEHFAAVAAAIRFADRMRQKRR